MKEMFLNSQATTDRFLRQGIFIICLFANANRSSVYLTMALPRSHYIFTVPYLFFHLISSLTLEPNRLFIYFFFISDDDLLLFFFSYFLSGCLFHVLPFTFWPNPVYLWWISAFLTFFIFFQTWQHPIISYDVHLAGFCYPLVFLNLSLAPWEKKNYFAGKHVSVDDQCKRTLFVRANSLTSLSFLRHLLAFCVASSEKGTRQIFPKGYAPTRRQK